MDQEKIGLFIRDLRLKNNMTQADLANKLNVTIQAVSKWERGRGLPDVSLLSELAKIFNISISEILNGEYISDNKNDFDLKTIAKYIKNDKELIITKFINLISFVVIIICSFTLILYNVKSIYYHHKTYKVETKYNSFDEINKSINKDIELIKNNKGNYSIDEYNYIISMINDYQNKYINYDKDKKILYKESYNIDDIEKYLKDIKNFNFDDRELIKILINHNSYDNFLNFYKTQIYKKYDYENYHFIDKVFEYDKTSGKEINKMVEDVVDFYIEKYMYFKLTLNFIIEAGEINE